MQISFAPYSVHPAFSGRFTMVKATEVPELIDDSLIRRDSEYDADWLATHTRQKLEFSRLIQRRIWKDSDNYKAKTLDEKQKTDEIFEPLAQDLAEEYPKLQRVLAKLRKIMKAPD